MLCLSVLPVPMPPVRAASPHRVPPSTHRPLGFHAHTNASLWPDHWPVGAPRQSYSPVRRIAVTASSGHCLLLRWRPMAMERMKMSPITTAAPAATCPGCHTVFLFLLAGLTLVSPAQASSPKLN